jgi:hypothetical protein
MPFTFSHPALILPLNYLPQKWFSLTGLVIGSITPDFEYFIRMTIQSDYSHTISGLFWFDLPLGILLAFLFHSVVRNSLFNNLPFILKSRIWTFRFFDWNIHFRKNFLVVIISVLIGAASHILWDGFTHYDGYFVKVFPALKNKMEVAGYPIARYEILQHVSTLIGGIIIAFALLRLPADRTVTRKINYHYWISVFVITAIIISIRWLVGLTIEEYGNIMVSCISGGLIALVLSPLFVREESITSRNNF